MSGHTGQYIGGGRSFRKSQLLLPYFFQLFRERVQLPCTQYKIQMRKFFEQIIAQPLSHAARHTDDQSGFAVFQLFHVADLAFGFAFGCIPDTAGVEDQGIGFLFGKDDAVSLAFQLGCHGIRITFIHLTAVGFDVDFHLENSFYSNVRLSR